jgi:hypothetical protein
MAFDEGSTEGADGAGAHHNPQPTCAALGRAAQGACLAHIYGWLAEQSGVSEPA